MVSIESRALTVRLSPDLYSSASTLAKKRRVSLNALIQQQLAEAVKAEEERELYEAFERFGQEGEASGVEYALPAQAEVILNDRP